MEEYRLRKMQERSHLLDADDRLRHPAVRQRAAQRVTRLRDDVLPEAAFEHAAAGKRDAVEVGGIRLRTSRPFPACSPAVRPIAAVSLTSRTPLLAVLDGV